MGCVKQKSCSRDSVQNRYFRWLCNIIGADDPDHSYMFLADHLHHMDFYWSVCNDDNRAEDGLKLREVFEFQEGPIGSELVGRCSVLEMLIALAIRIEDILDDGETDRTTEWFWMMIENLGLEKFTDDEYYLHGNQAKINKILDRFLDRKYFQSGKGGLFPLKKTRVDQRTVEIWYQMQAYLDENF